MKTEELKQRYRKAFGYGLWEDAEKGMISRDHEVLTFIQSEIEAAERRRTEEVVEMLKRIEDVYLPERSAEDMGRTHALERAILQISSKFLKNPER